MRRNTKTQWDLHIKVNKDILSQVHNRWWRSKETPAIKLALMISTWIVTGIKFMLWLITYFKQSNLKLLVTELLLRCSGKFSIYQMGGGGGRRGNTSVPACNQLSCSRCCLSVCLWKEFPRTKLCTFHWTHLFLLSAEGPSLCAPPARQLANPSSVSPSLFIHGPQPCRNPVWPPQACTGRRRNPRQAVCQWNRVIQWCDVG